MFFFNFEMYSLVINTAKLVNRAVLLEIKIPAPGLIKPVVELLKVEADPIRISVIILKNSFSLMFYISF